MFKDSPNRRVHFTFPLRIPFNNILPLQAIDQYCQEVFENMHFESSWNPKEMVCCSVDLKTTFKDTYLETIKPSETSQWACDQQNQMWLMNLPDENSCTHEFTQIGQQFIMSCGWNNCGVQGQMPGSTAYQWNVIVKPYPCKVSVHNCFLQPLQSVMKCYKLIDIAIETVRNYYYTHIDIWLTKWIKIENIPTAQTQSGLNISVSNSLWNTTDIIILFPRT
jgi:hypothetical protein